MPRFTGITSRGYVRKLLTTRARLDEAINDFEAAKNLKLINDAVIADAYNLLEFACRFKGQEEATYDA